MSLPLDVDLGTSWKTTLPTIGIGFDHIAIERFGLGKVQTIPRREQ